jgi:hypothetical protein
MQHQQQQQAQPRNRQHTQHPTTHEPHPYPVDQQAQSKLLVGSNIMPVLQQLQPNVPPLSQSAFSQQLQQLTLHQQHMAAGEIPQSTTQSNLDSMASEQQPQQLPVLQQSQIKLLVLPLPTTAAGEYSPSKQPTIAKPTTTFTATANTFSNLISHKAADKNMTRASPASSPAAPASKPLARTTRPSTSTLARRFQTQAPVVPVTAFTSKTASDTATVTNKPQEECFATATTAIPFNNTKQLKPDFLKSSQQASDCIVIRRPP